MAMTVEERAGGVHPPGREQACPPLATDRAQPSAFVHADWLAGGAEAWRNTGTPNPETF